MLYKVICGRDYRQISALKFVHLLPPATGRLVVSPLGYFKKTPAPSFETAECAELSV